MTPVSDQATSSSQALEQERRRLFNLLDELPAIVYLRAPDYSIHFANRYFRQRFGDPTAGPCYRVIHDRSVPCVPCGCETALAGGQLLESEWVFADDTSYQLYDYPFVDVDGVEKVLHLGIDTTKRRQAEAELERANRELLALSQEEHRERILAEFLSAASLALTQTLDLDAILNNLMDMLTYLVPYEGGRISLLEDKLQLVPRTVRGYVGTTNSRLMTPLRVDPEQNSHLAEAIQSGKSLWLAATEQETGWVPHAGFEEARSYLAVPMLIHGRAIGLCELQKRGAEKFTQRELWWTEALSGQAAAVIQNAWMYERMKESREQLQSLSRRLVEVQESERRYVARELHDEAGQALTSLKIQLKLLQRSATDPDRVRAGLSELIGEVEVVMEGLHRLAMDLRPASLDHLGLIAALEQYCQTLAGQHTIQLAFEALGVEGRLAPEVEIALYRIVQEALNNMVRHARATRADVLLERRGDRIVVIVEDNGRGFDPEAASGSERLGLLGIRERAMALGGNLTIESSPSGGTALFVEVPDAYPGVDRG